MTAQAIVEYLLDERQQVCALCQREMQIQPGHDQAHVPCRRHFIDDLQRKGTPPPRAEQEANRYGNSRFSPDLRQQRQQLQTA